jgi:hypothetical protein
MAAILRWLDWLDTHPLTVAYTLVAVLALSAAAALGVR